MHVAQHHDILEFLEKQLALIAEVASRDHAFCALARLRFLRLSPLLRRRFAISFHIPDGLGLQHVPVEYAILPVQGWLAVAIFFHAHSESVLHFEDDFAQKLPADHADLIQNNEGRLLQALVRLAKCSILSLPLRIGPRGAAPDSDSEGTVRRRCPELHLERSRARGRYKYCSILNGLRIYSSPRALIRGTRFLLT